MHDVIKYPGCSKSKPHKINIRNVAGKSGAWLSAPSFSSEDEESLVPNHFCLCINWVSTTVSSLSPHCSFLPCGLFTLIECVIEESPVIVKCRVARKFSSVSNSNFSKFTHRVYATLPQPLSLHMNIAVLCSRT